LDTSIDIAKLLLTEILAHYFKLTKHELKQGELHFYFTELNSIPDEFKEVKLCSIVFFPETTVQDFPIKNKNIYLHIIRRRWLNESSKIVITIHCQLIAKGTRITSEFATFLKQISQ
jgi:hypothetical protein